MKAQLKAAAYRYLGGHNARIIYVILAIVALVLGAGAPDAIGIGGGGGGG